jgi:hypothetical protein
MGIITELIKRFLSEKPQIFKWVRIIGLIAGVVIGIPALLSAYGVDLGASFNTLIAKLVGVAGWVAAFVAQLTATTAAKTEKGIKD